MLTGKYKYLTYSAVTAFFLCFFLSGNAQEVPIVKIQPDSVSVKVKKDAPDGFLSKLLYYLSPRKYVEKFIATNKILDTIPPKTRDTLLNLRLKSTLAYDFEKVKPLGLKTEDVWDTINKIRYLPPVQQKGPLTHVVYGYHPYWMGTAYKSYNFSLLSRLAYFSCELNPATGDFTTTNNWASTPLVDLAHSGGCKVDLCITSFGADKHHQFFTNPQAQDRCISNIIGLLELRGGDGVNIDFENIPKVYRSQFTGFIQKLRTALDQKDTSLFLTIAIPAVDWANVFDVVAMAPSVNYFIIMGYDFYGKNSRTAGPNAPLHSDPLWGELNITKSVQYYFDLGILKNQILLGLPYYGKEWETDKPTFPATVFEFRGSKTYREIARNYADFYEGYFDTISSTSYYIFRKDNIWVQCWTDDELSLHYKYNFVLKSDIAGVAIWALGYDNGYTELWDLLARKFSGEAGPEIYVMTKEDSLKLLKKSLLAVMNESIIDDENNTIAEEDAMPFIQEFRENLNSYYRIATLVLVVLLIFTSIGFFVSISDYNVRDILFNTEVRLYMFLFLLLTLVIVILRILGIIINRDIVLILGLLFGIFTMFVIGSITRMKRGKKSELRP
ncbi:MAG: hypothetical protein KKA07_15315 [Bacteroidetes bacterium]|nr:hypothetical protein [Bacteroidota bacterium]MBU1720431.1 hypothetical protein [Bacteroidota bacterium]